MERLEFSAHTIDMLAERQIPEDWVWQTINSPDSVTIVSDDNTHYIKSIVEYGGRFLRVIVNHHVEPNRVVTVFFDRRLRSKK